MTGPVGERYQWDGTADGTWFRPVLPTGYSEVVKVARRKLDARGVHDPVRATIELYDLSGRLSDVWLAAVPDALSGGAMVRPHWHYECDARGNQIRQTDPKGHVTTWTYDEQGHRASRTLPADGDGDTSDDTERWTYDGFGRTLSHVAAAIRLPRSAMG